MAPSLISVTPCSNEALAARHAILDKLEAGSNSSPKWNQVGGAEVYRRMRREGTAPFTKPFVHPGAVDLQMKLRDGKSIILRKFQPSKSQSKGVVLHIHGGGWVINSAYTQDAYLARLSEDLSLTFVSIDYRLAPEHPFPIPNEDCVDAALYALSDNGVQALGGPLIGMIGESAGAQLAICTVLALKQINKIDVKSKVPWLVLSFGQYDLSGTPSMHNYKRNVLVSKADGIEFTKAYLGNKPHDLRNPQISPLFADIKDLKDMPAALFLVGDEDIMVDDSVFMAARWSLAGNEAVLKVVRAAGHGFTWFPLGEVTEEGIGEIESFIKGKV